MSREHGILGLLADLYVQLMEAQERIAELEAKPEAASKKKGS